MVLIVFDNGNREQRRDRSALHDVEDAVGETPFDVLRAPQARLDLSSQLDEVHDLGVGQGGPIVALAADRFLLRRAAGRCSPDHELLRADRSGDDLAVAHPVHVGVHPTRDQRLAETEARPRPPFGST
jgi:hypothetical protein